MFKREKKNKGKIIILFFFQYWLLQFRN